MELVARKHLSERLFHRLQLLRHLVLFEVPNLAGALNLIEQFDVKVVTFFLTDLEFRLTKLTLKAFQIALYRTGNL